MENTQEKLSWERPVLKKGDIKAETQGGTGSAKTDIDFTTS